MQSNEQRLKENEHLTAENCLLAQKVQLLLQKLPADLPVVKTVIEPDDVKANTEAYKRIGEEVSKSSISPQKKFLSTGSKQSGTKLRNWTGGLCDRKKAYRFSGG